MRKQLITGAAALAMHSALAADHGARYGQKDGSVDTSPEGVAAAVKEMRDLGQKLANRDVEIAAEVKKLAEALAAGAGKETLDGIKSELQKLAEGGTALQARLTELEQRAARSPANDSRAKSLGFLATESDEFKAALAKGSGFKGRASYAVKATITSATNDAAGSAGDLIRPDRLAGIVAPPDRPLTIRSLLMPGRTSSNAVEYVKETGFTNNAAPVAEAAAKPQSDLKFDIETVSVKTLAHWVLATKQILDDVPQLQSYIDGRLRYGLAYVEESQLLTGDGTGQNILGLIPQATDFDSSRSLGSDTRIDTIRRAMTQVRLAEYRASGIVMHPADWEAIELTKDSTGSYIFANPQGIAGPTLWGRPVIETQAVAEGEFLVGAFNMAAQIFDREDTVVEISTEDSDNFRKNLVTIRAEQRLAMAVFRPEALVHGFFEGPTGG